MADKEKDPAFLYYETDVALDVSLLHDRTERGCYFDLIQQYRRFRGFTMEQLRNILGRDFELCWPAIQLVLDYEDIEGKYHIRWLRESVANRSNFNKNQSDRIKKYWEKVKKEEAEAVAAGRTVVKRRKKVVIKSDIPRNNHGITTDIPIENGNGNGNGNQEVDGIGGTGEEEGEDVENWKVMPDEQQYDLGLPEIKAGSARALMRLNGIEASEDQILKLWEVFKVQNFTGKSFYSCPNEAYRHFINWSKTQKINGNSQENQSGEPKLGTSAARVKKASEW